MGSQKRPYSSQEGSVSRSPSSKRLNSQAGGSHGSSKNETAASRSKIQRILNTHRLYLDRQRSKPTALRDLLEEICQVRDGPPTPDSREIARIHPFTCLMQELDAIISLEDYLGYKSEYQRGGQSRVYRGHNHSWRKGSIPCPNTKDREYLTEALASVGSPPDPRPDIAYGYSNTAFGQQEQDILASLPQDTNVCSDEPRFPYFVLEWKSSRGGGNMWDAERQAVRDGSAAVNAMWNWCQAMGITNPCPADTAVFSACVDSRTIALRVHWRSIANNSEACFEADLINEGFLRSEADNFRIRSIILNMLEWARERRLDFIRQTLSKRLPTQDEDQPSQSTSQFDDDVNEVDNTGHIISDLPTPAPSNTSSPVTPSRKKRRISG